MATFIKELVLEPEPGSPLPAYQPGDVPAIRHSGLRRDIVRRDRRDGPFAEIWKAQGVFDFRAENPLPVRRNFSMASDPSVDKQLRFNVRISLPPRGLDCSAGAGSTYLHRLRPGDKITAIGPFGTFHIKPTGKEMVYLGGGAGMAPLALAPGPSLRDRARPAAASASGTAPARCGKVSTRTTSRTWPGDSPTSASTWRFPSPSPRTTGNRTRASSTRFCGRTTSPATPIPPASNTTSAVRRPWSRPR